MRRPDDIKTGLEQCLRLTGQCHRCPYDRPGNGVECQEELKRDARAYMLLLEKHLDRMTRLVPVWTSVEDALPEPAGLLPRTVTVRTVDGKVMPGFKDTTGWYIMREDCDYCDEAGEDEVTHWVALPAWEEE